jgi:hypothetical protein
MIGEAQASYEASGRQLRDDADFGDDPLGSNTELQIIRERLFASRLAKSIVFITVLSMEIHSHYMIQLPHS